MRWQLLHRLFGWDYVHLRNTATEIVRRVHYTAAGERFVRYFGHHLVFIDRPGCAWTVHELTRRWNVFETATVIEDAS